MKNIKKILAIICVVLLVAMYVATFIMSILDSSATMYMFKGCVALTIFIPVVAYIYICLHKYAMYRSKRSDPYRNDPHSPSAGDTSPSDDKQR